MNFSLKPYCRMVLLSVALFLNVFNTFSQTCDGADGLFPPLSGNTVIANGDICANTAVIPYRWEVTYTNVDDNGNPNNVEFFIDWSDGTTQVVPLGAGVDFVEQTAPNSYRAVVTHFFPIAGADVMCEYIPEVSLRVNGITCPSTMQNPAPVVRWNTDDQNTGRMELSEDNTGNVIFEVCAGETATVRFVDRSEFNCIPANFPGFPPNVRTRWFQFIYGGDPVNNTISGSGITINTNTGSNPEGNGPVNLSGGATYISQVVERVQPIDAPTEFTFDITVPADAQIGEEFAITLNNWNVCNPYQSGGTPTGNLPSQFTGLIRIIDSPPAPAYTPIEFCAGDPNILSVGASNGGLLTWYSDAALSNVIGTGNTLNAQTDPPAANRVNNNVAGTYTYYATETLGNNCEGPPATVSFVIYDNPTPANAGQDQTICADVTTLQGNVPSIGNGVWSVISGPGVVTNPAVFNSAVTNVTSTTVLEWKVINGICKNSDTMTIYRDSPPNIADAGNNQILCSASLALSGNTPLSGTGEWSVTSGNATFANLNDPGTVVSDLNNGPNILRWTISNTCSSNFDEITIVNNMPGPANAGPDQSVCTNTTFLQAEAPIVGNGTWAVLSGDGLGTIVNPSLRNSEFRGTPGVSYTLEWTVSNGICADNLDQVQIEFVESPSVSVAGTNQVICGNSTSLDANVPVTGSGQWNVISGDGNEVFNNLNDPKSVFTGTEGVIYQLEWIISNGSCTPSISGISIQFDAVPTAPNAGINQVLCGSTTTLQGNVITIGTGVWTEVSGDGQGIFSDINDPLSTFTGTPGTIYELEWMATNGSCAPKTDRVNIQFDPGPDFSNAGPDQQVCGSSTAMDANVPVIGSGKWNVVSGDGFGAFVNVNDSKTSFSGTLGQVYLLQWTIASGTCIPQTDQITVQFDDSPTVANAGTNQTVCGNTTFLDANYPVVGSGFWSLLSNPDGAGAFANTSDPKSGFSGTEGVTYSLRWAISNGSCTSSFSDVQIIFDAAPSVPLAGADQNICGNVTSLEAEIPASGQGRWSVVSNPDGAGTVANELDPVSSFTGSFDQEYVLRWTVSNGVCSPVYDEVTVNVGPEFIPLTISGPVGSCVGEVVNYTLPGADPLKYNYIWDVSEIAPSVTVIPGSGSPFQFISLQINKSFIGNINVWAEDKSTGCTGPVASASVIAPLLPDLVLESNDPDQFVCESQEVVFTATDLNGVATQYDFILNGQLVQSGSGNTYITSSLSVGNSMVVKGYNGACASKVSNPVTHTINLNPVAFNVLGGGEFCEGGAGVSVVLNNSVTGEVYELYIDDVPTGTTITSAGGQLTFVNQTQPGQYTIYANNGSGCVNKMNGSVSVVVNALPGGTLYGENEICQGSESLIVFELTGKAPFSIEYWEGNLLKSISGASEIHPVLVSPKGNTLYKIQSVTDANGCSGFPANEQVQIQVITPLVNVVPPPVLEGCSPLELTFENQNISPNTTYEWIWGDGTPKTVSSSQQVSHIFNNGSSSVKRIYTVTLNAYYDDGRLYCANSSSVDVTVYPDVVPDVQPDQVSGCSPLYVSFSNRSRGAQSHSWFYREKGTNQQLGFTTEKTPVLNLVNSGSNPVIYEIIYEASNSNCSNGQVTEVEVFPEVKADFTVNGSYTPSSVIITDANHASLGIKTPNNAGWSYLWDYGDGNTSVGYWPISPYKYAEPGDYTMTLSVSEPGGGCFDEYSITLRVEAVFPIFDFTADPVSGCRPLKVQFTNKSFSVDPSSYLWEFINSDGQIVGTSQMKDPEFTFYDAGFYTVRLSGKNIQGTEGAETKVNMIEVYSRPTAAFLIRPEKLFIPGGVLYTQNLSINATDYVWDFGDGTTSTLYAPEHEYTKTGNFTVQLTAINSYGCSDTLSMPGVVQVMEGGTLRVPNAFTPSLDGPTGGIAGPGTYNDVFKPIIEGVTEYQMLIFDRWGNLLFATDDPDIGWDGYDKNGRLMPTGVYVYKLRLKFGNGEYFEKIGDVTLLR